MASSELTPDNGAELFYSLHEPLGALAMEFAELEARLTQSINLLLKIDDRDGRILEAVMQNFSMRINLFHALAATHPRHPKVIKEADKIARRLNEANARRNNFLHNEWTMASVGSVGKSRYKAQDGKLREIKLHDVSIAQVWDTVDYIHAVNCRLVRWEQCFRRPIPETWSSLSDEVRHSPRRKSAEAKINAE